MLLTVTETLVKVQVREFTQIKFLKLEKVNGIFTQETFNYSFSTPQTSVVITVDNSSNEILIVLLELNLAKSELVYYNGQEENTENTEIKDQLENVKNMFGGENVLSLNESTVEETNNIFNNFGKGLSSMFSMGPTPQNGIISPKDIEIKNENSKLSWKIKKKPVNG